jgi:predicted signal transduction protein with EAL and GGDEF domain
MLAAMARRALPAAAPASGPSESQAHVRQLAEWRDCSFTDTLTGLSLRHHFVEGLELRMADTRPGGRALLLLRVPNLDVLRLRLGLDATERLLCAVGHLLLIYLDRVPGAIAGRLNDSDFALYLPASGVARETAHSLREALAALTSLRSVSIAAWVGGVDGLPCLASGNALAEADAALARAEAGEGGGVVVEAHIDLQVAARGSAAWRWQVAEALDGGRIRLQATRVLDRHGDTVHLRCEPQLQLSQEAVFQSARLGLALARRSGLLPRLDGVTARLALRATAEDGVARCVRLGAPSLATAGFADGLASALLEMPAQAKGLSLLLSAPEQPQALPAVLSATAKWRRAGARVGIDCTGVSPDDLVALAAAGVGFVTLQAQHLRGLAADESLIEPATRLLAAIQGMGLMVLAEQALAAEDLAVAWHLGLDGAPASSTGEAASAGGAGGAAAVAVAANRASA